MKRILVILVVVAVGGYFTYDYYQEKVNAEAARAENERKKQLRDSEIALMVNEHNADDSWEGKLGSGRQNIGRQILTMDLEKLWLVNKPIMFKGCIEDISSYDRNNYRIKLSGLPRLDTQLALDVISPKHIIDSFLAAHPKEPRFSAVVAVIAKIDRIETMHINTDEGKKEIKIGIGQCQGIRIFRDWIFDAMFDDKIKKQ
jgi:hypothetical protein